ncbi:MAG: EF-P lysine aminoacylase EpmA [Hyphomicrobiaceae bacterium]
MTTDQPWWDKARHADRRPFLLARSRIATAFRRWFAAQDFIEVETSALQRSPGNETHLHAFATEAVGLNGTRWPLYLRTSPELACKKLLAAGERRIVDFARVFRNREAGRLHAPEFTMVEWYRAGEPYNRLFEDVSGLVGLAADVAGAARTTYRGRSANPNAAPELLTVDEAFRRHAGIDLLGTIEGREGRTVLLRQEAERSGVATAADDTWSDIFSKVLVARIEPQLGVGRPTILYEYPVVEAALARPSPADPRVAERFELYLCGVELANGFGELIDPVEQRRRFEADMAEKQRLYGERYPIDEDFLAALAQMPEASGVALGFDRLVMLVTGAERLDQVQWDPVPGPANP